MEHYVYVGTLNDEIVYVGKGSGDRYLHLNSGTSSSYLANKAHFEGSYISVKIIERFETSEEALAHESALIEMYAPKWNYQIKGQTRRKPRSYKGVQFMKNKAVNPWRAYIHVDGVKKHIGYYPTEREAEEARTTYY